MFFKKLGIINFFEQIEKEGKLFSFKALAHFTMEH